MRVLVTLNAQELREACHGGIERRIDAIKRGRKSTHPETPYHKQNWWQSDINGAIGEYAVAKALGVTWNPAIGQVDQKDVAEYEVRTTELPNPVLRYRGHNDPNSTYILCSIKNNVVLIQGWLPGYVVKDLGYMEFDNVWTAGIDQLYSVADLNTDILWSDTVTPYGQSRAS